MSDGTDPSSPLAERRMSDSESLMWRLEKDPYLASTFGSVSVLDRPIDVDRFRARMAQAVAAVPRLGWRVLPNPADLGAPIWADDPDFDIDQHLRHIALPAPGTMDQLFDIASRYVLDPLDRARPLWQFLVVDGLEGGRSAVVQKMHHTIADGITAIKLSMQYLDIDPEATEPVGGFVEERVVAPTPPPPSTFDTVRGLLEGSFRIPLTLARQVGDLLADPLAIPKASTDAVETVKAIVAQLGDTEQAHSPLWQQRSLRRQLVAAGASFRATKAAAAKLGGTLNTAFLTIVTEAAARYHDERGAPVESLRASMAVSTRTEQSGSNAFSLVRLLVPTGPMKLRDRFAAIAESTESARTGSRNANLDIVATISSVLPATLLTRVVRTQAQTVDFATSNVRGASIPMYIAGARLLANYPIGPLLGVAVNATMLSYNGSLDFGVNCDAAAVDDPARLGALIERSAKALARA